MGVSQLARVACTVMLKNEHALVNAFLHYHANLFGPQNLFVVDNGSTDPITLRYLAEFEAKGVNVDRSFTTADDYTRKGLIIGNLVQQLDRDYDYDFYILLDCDEFVVLKLDDSYTCDGERIHRYFDSLKGEKRILRVGRNLPNILGRPFEFQELDYQKTIFPKNVLAETDHGHHVGRSRTGKGDVACDIVYVHYHYRPYNEVVWYARQKLITETSAEVLDDVLRLRSYKGPGQHMIGYLLDGSESYYEQFRDVSNTISFTELGDQFLKLGIAAPFNNFRLPSRDETSSAAGRNRMPVFVVVESASVNSVVGWAVDTGSPDTPTFLKFLVDGAVVYEGRCDQARPDVLASGFKAERVGFFFTLPKLSRDGRRHVLTVQNSSDIPIKIYVGGVERVEIDLFTDGMSAAARQPITFGYVDSLDDGRVQGWALRSIFTPNGVRLLGHNTVALLHAAELVVQAVADVKRPDVVQAMKGEAECGFSFQIPSALTSGPERRQLRLALQLHD